MTKAEQKKQQAIVKKFNSLYKVGDAHILSYIQAVIYQGVDEVEVGALHPNATILKHPDTWPHMSILCRNNGLKLSASEQRVSIAFSFDAECEGPKSFWVARKAVNEMLDAMVKETVK